MLTKMLSIQVKLQKLIYIHIYAVSYREITLSRLIEIS